MIDPEPPDVAKPGREDQERHFLGHLSATSTGSAKRAPVARASRLVRPSHLKTTHQHVRLGKENNTGTTKAPTVFLFVQMLGSSKVPLKMDVIHVVHIKVNIYIIIYIYTLLYILLCVYIHKQKSKLHDFHRCPSVQHPGFLLTSKLISS